MSRLLTQDHASAGTDCDPGGACESPRSSQRVAVPAYLQKIYWWAYVHPNAVRFFEREWLVNLILFGNYRRLRDIALADLVQAPQGRTLQVACVYGDLTPRLHTALDGKGELHVVDVLPVQLANLRRKLPSKSGVTLWQRDSAAMGFPDASFNQVLMFFLLHEQPEAVRRRTLAEACRVVKPGGKIVIVDYHQPSRWNPLGLPLQILLRRLEPYARDLFSNELESFLPEDVKLAGMQKDFFYGGLYQKVVLTR
ncbi:MAG TPA: rhodoquinone biosynthesis methyltransferase RquA [Noviherbaspirillum sp.]|jgi:ubiquinone/menaquinone biosynthesis C-methylase UbiE